MKTGGLENIAGDYLRDGHLAEALDAYTRLCNLQPGNAKAWHMQAAVSGMLGQFENTVFCCEKALAIIPNAVAVYENYASALIELKRHNEAIHALQQAIELNPAAINNLNRLGNLHRTLNNLSEAEICFRKIITMAPDKIDACSNLAHILKESGRFQESIAVCEKSLSTGPVDITILTALLECYFIIGETDKAYQKIVSAKPLLKNLEPPLHAICRKLHANKQYVEDINAIVTILKVFPENIEFKLILADCQIQLNDCQDAIKTLTMLGGAGSCKACLLLAQACQKTNQIDEAIARLADAIHRYPDEEGPVALLARILVESGKTHAAHLELAAFLEKHPDSHRILVELGNICELEGEHTLAEKHYRRAISIQPDYAIAHHQLGILFQNRRQNSAARECFEKAIHHDPDMLITRCNLAYLYCVAGEYVKSQNYYNSILEKDPGLEEAITGKATVMELMGEDHASLKLVNPLIERGTEKIHTLLAYARVSSIINEEVAATELLECAVKRPETLPNDLMQAYFLLGKLHDHLGQYDKAFFNYERGNRLNQFRFDRSTHQKLVDDTLAVFNPKNMKHFPRSENPDSKLLFIIGMPRSGTTLIEQILASHPEVFGAGELTHICDITAAIPVTLDSQHLFPLYMSGINLEILDHFSFGHTKTIQTMTNGQAVVTDKMPSNFVFLGLIELLFPNARILHCMRDPIDTCLSCYFQLFSQGQYFSYNHSDLAFYYQQYKRLMAHWKSTLSIPIMDVHYEELVNDPESITRSMLKFSGLDWHDGCLDFYKTKREVRTASYDQVRKPVYKSSVNRWKNYERHLLQLKEELSRV